MQGTIAQVTELVNTSSNIPSYDATTQDSVLPHPCNHSLLHSWHTLTNFQKQILYFYYTLRLQGIESSDYGCVEMGIRFKRHPDYVSREMAPLHEVGWLGGTHGGSRKKHRWITCEGFAVLDALQSGQMSGQIETIPNIYLSDSGSDCLKITEDAQNCGQDRPVTPDQALDEFLNQEKVPLSHQMRIKKCLKTAPIGPVRRESIIRRVVAVGRKMFIKSKLAYFMTAISKEVKEVNDLIQHLKRTKLPSNPYETDNLTELGCFA